MILSLGPTQVFNHKDRLTWPEDQVICVFVLVDPSVKPPKICLDGSFLGRFFIEEDVEPGAGHSKLFPVILDADEEQRFFDGEDIPDGHLLLYSTLEFAEDVEQWKVDLVESFFEGMK